MIRRHSTESLSAGKRRIAESWLLLCTLLWGGTFVVIPLGLNDASPLFFVSIRFFIASVLFFPGFLKKVRGNFSSVFPGMISGFAMLSGFVLQTTGLEYTTPARSAFITQLLILFTPPLQYLILKKKPDRGIYIALPVVLAGMFLLTSPEKQAWNTGDWLTLGSAWGFALYIVLISLYSKRYDLSILIFIQTFTTALVSLFLSLSMEEIQVNWSLSLGMALFYLAPLATNVPVFLQNRFQKETTPVRASFLFTMEPVFATIFSAIFLMHIPTPWELLGSAVMVAGLLYFSYLSARGDNSEAV